MDNFFKRIKINSGDIWGGLAASVIILPQAMAFGVTLLTSSGFDASRGAIMGLLAASIVCFFSGILGGTRGLVSSPTGPILVLLGGALSSLSQINISGEGLLLNLVAIIVLTGVFQILIGISGGGKLIKYIPYSVISGFLTGSAFLMILSQVKLLFKSGPDGAWLGWDWLPFLVAMITVATIHISTKKFRKLPSTLVGLFVGTLFFHLIVLFNQAELPVEWVIGKLPNINSIGITFPKDILEQLSWSIIVSSALALSILSSLDTLLTSVIADVTTGERHNANIEMIGQGIGQIVSGFIGGMAAAGTTGATVVSVNSGGRRWVGVFASLFFLFLLLVARDINSLLPISALAGIIFYVSLRMLDLDIISWLKLKNMRSDAFIAILVTIVTVSYNMMVAVIFGVLISVILFIKQQINSRVISRRLTGNHIHSIRKRKNKERKILENNCNRIILYELKGNLFFATADSLLDELSADLNKQNYIILHMRKVLHIDLTAMKYIQQIASRLHKNGGQLIFCNVYEELNFGDHLEKNLSKMSHSANDCSILVFNGKDEALEFAENELLKEAGIELKGADNKVSLKENDLCHGLGVENEAELEKVLKKTHLKKGEVLFEAGDYGDEVYMLISGEIEIRLPITKHHYKHLLTYQAGSFLGELSMLEPGPRVANAIVTHDVELFSLDNKGLQELAKKHPETAVYILNRLAKIQAEYLRWTTKELRLLSEW